MTPEGQNRPDNGPNGNRKTAAAGSVKAGLDIRVWQRFRFSRIAALSLFAFDLMQRVMRFLDSFIPVLADLPRRADSTLETHETPAAE